MKDALLFHPSDFILHPLVSRHRVNSDVRRLRCRQSSENDCIVRLSGIKFDRTNGGSTITKNGLAKGKRHLLFAGVLLIVLTISIVIEMIAGESLLRATWNTFREIRPMEYGMILLFWYICAFHKPKDEWNSSFTTLDLRIRESKKG